MSIASRITSIENHIEEAYTEISRLGVDLTNVDKNIDNIADKLQDVYADLPKVTGEGSSLSLTPTRKGGLSIIPKGACEQDSYSGKNQLDITKVIGSSITITNDTLVLSASSGYNSTNNNVNLSSICPNLVVGQSYILTFDTTETTEANRDKMFLRGSQELWEKGTTHTITQEELDDRIAFYGKNNAVISNLMIRLSSVTDATYEKYVGGIPGPNPDYPQDIRVVTGENSVVVSNQLFDKDKTTDTYFYNASGEQEERVSTDFEYINQEYNLSNTTIKIKYTSRIRYAYVRVCEYNGSTFIKRTMVTNNNTNVTLDNNTNKVIFSTDASSYQHFEDLQIISKQQTYTIHLGTEYLAGIGDYKDEIVGKTDNWKIRRYVGKVEFDGGDDENWIDTVSYERMKIEVSNFKSPASAIVANILCNKMIAYSRNTIGLHDYAISAGNENTSDIWARANSTINTVAKFKTWLTTHNLLVYYELETPIEETITNQTLITDLNNMYQAMGYDGTTNITITSSNAQMTASVSALKGE